MTFHNGFDDRAVSPLIGAILLLAILVALLGLLQLNAVPALTVRQSSSTTNTSRAN
ncbi:archaellin/type IV pilin N-terminal domain-containing protein [Natronorubrum bangense]|uniref:archaellin/type IV pilin N-terminal domain-containing protein n=1 Tax=Natronorubrum bangense TaxID=61858 RepID=UPI001F0CE55A|nr:archaellin/type IV pilin N-terminal domain-containing protein [Natronorubrum bangense]